MKKSFIFAVLVCLVGYGCGQPIYRYKKDALQALQREVDLGKYVGLWYEVYRIPNDFESFSGQEASDVVAFYSLSRDGKTINVENRCKAAGGVIKSAKGIARVSVGDGFNSKLEVSFFRPFYGDYWILDLDDDYNWAIIGEPKGKYLWVLARTKILDPSLENSLLEKVEALGYSRRDLIKTVHNSEVYTDHYCVKRSYE